MNSFKDIRHQFTRMADAGKIKSDHVPMLEAAAIFEMAGDRFGSAFYGKAWDTAKDDVEAASSDVMEKWAAKARDVSVMSHRLAQETIVTTLDLPATVGRARDVAIREAQEVGTDSPLLAGAARRTARDFRPMPGLRRDLDSLGLFKQPEGTNVRYEPFAYTEDDYAIVKYNRAIGWTWEARLADDLGVFLDMATALGYSARLNRVRVMLAAIVAGTTRSTLGGAGGPDVARVQAAREALADANARFGAVSIPVEWEGVAEATRANQYIPNSNPAEVNPVYSAFGINVEELMPEVFGAAPSGNAADWAAHDATISNWLEFATLSGFEGGPRMRFKLPDARDDLGSFDNMTDAMSILDAVGAKVTDATRVLRIAGG